MGTAQRKGTQWNELKLNKIIIAFQVRAQKKKNLNRDKVFFYGVLSWVSFWVCFVFALSVRVDNFHNKVF